ncbi:MULTISPECIES: hypothetical protein [Paenibacillus]|uniref:hypothetical protein n=1 Tax=Paenibacillus TaxID=44249 RepID=UPI001FFE9D62|nr:hypothetical protein [Paenibacillus pabuli]UPK42148.1 hypothetical protein KET34_23420 [Paenibacillus pabuli]
MVCFFWQRCELRVSNIGTSLHAAFMPALDTGAYPYAPNLGVTEKLQDIGCPAAQTVNPADIMYCMPVPDKVWTKNNAISVCA